MKTRTPWWRLSLFTALVVIWVAPSRATVPLKPMASTVSTTPHSAQQLELQGRSHYQAGQFAEAATAFRAAAAAYQAQGNRLKQAISLSNLALCQQHLGGWQEASQSITTSLELLYQSGATSPDRQSALAQTLDIQGSLYFAQGNPQLALESWEQAATRYRATGNTERAVEGQINQAQALQALGRYRRAIAVLTSELKLEPAMLDQPNVLSSTLPRLSAQPTTITALQSLGEALRVTGNLKSAQALLQHSLALAERTQQPNAIATGSLRLGNLIRTQAIATLNLSNLSIEQAVDLIKKNQQGQRSRNTDLALVFEQQMRDSLALYQRAATTTTNPSDRIQAQLNQLSLFSDIQQWGELQSLYNQIQIQVNSLPTNHLSITARINLAQQWIKSSTHHVPATLRSTAQSLAEAAQQANMLNDLRAKSFALGTLGKLYEQSGQLPEALDLTHQALSLAQLNQAADIAYLWHWQTGRILKRQGNLHLAIAAYQRAVTTLQSVRKELVVSAIAEQFAFRDTIEPIHRELVSLLLDVQTNTPNPDYLVAVRNTIESLQLTELVNFFREDCLIARPQQIDQTDPTAAILYPIVLPDRLAVIVSLPGQPLTYYATARTEGVTQARLEIIVNQLQRSLKQGNIPEANFLPMAEQLYDWLIRPVQRELAAKQIKTLVFVPDGVLRNIPMSVLHDRQQNQYLIEQYSIALTPGLQLLGSRPLTQRSSKTLVAGLTEARSGFSALPNVKQELQQIAAQVEDSQVFLNERFTTQNFQANLKTMPFPIVHLATHGQFSSQLENTFILTWDGRLNINELKDVLQASTIRSRDLLELLVLSACETAAGDNRAILGLAGMAVRAGARSTIATLWQVNDTSSATAMGQLYRELAYPNMTKAEALRRVQLSLLNNSQMPEYHHPYYWAAYVLVGNWQ